MGILNGAKEQMKWGNLKYLGGYPNKKTPVVCGIYKENGQIEIHGGTIWQLQFSIPKEDILKLEIRENKILMKIKYGNAEIELQFAAPNVQYSYNKITTAIYQDNDTPLISKTNELSKSNIDSQKTKFYETTWFMWITLVLCAPVGIFLMWKYNRYNKSARIVVSAIFGLFFISIIASPNKNDKTNNSKNVATENVSWETTLTAEEKAKKDSDDKIKAEAQVKKDAEDKLKADADAKAKVEEEAKKQQDFINKNTKQFPAGIFTVGTHADAGIYDVTFNGSGNFTIHNSGGSLLSNEIGGSSNGVSKYRAMFTEGSKIKISGMSINIVPAQRSLSAYGDTSLYAGYWLVGQDVTKGRYKATATNDSGNFVIRSKSGSLKTNEILGDNGVNEVVVELENNDIIQISGLNQVNFTPTN